jgi:hypothetical protein
LYPWYVDDDDALVRVAHVPVDIGSAVAIAIVDVVVVENTTVSGDDMNLVYLQQELEMTIHGWKAMNS